METLKTDDTPAPAEGPLGNLGRAETDVLAGLARHICHHSPKPLHEQISALIRERVTTGRWRSHLRLPAEPEIARSLGVARGTVRRSVQTLVNEGLLVQHQGRGTFVRGDTLEQTFAQEIISTSQALDRDGLPYDTTVIRRSVEPVSFDGRKRLKLDSETSQVVAFRRVRSVEGVPVFVLDNYVIAARCPGLESSNVTNKPLFSVLEQDYGIRIDAVQRTFQAVTASVEVAKLLKIDLGSPVLLLQQTSYEYGDSPVEYSDVWIRGDKLRITSWVHR